MQPNREAGQDAGVTVTAGDLTAINKVNGMMKLLGDQDLDETVRTEANKARVAMDIVCARLDGRVIRRRRVLDTQTSIRDTDGDPVAPDSGA